MEPVAYLISWLQSYPQWFWSPQKWSLSLFSLFPHLFAMVLLVKAMILPVVKNGWKSWTIKRGEHWRANAFELWNWKRLVKVTEIAKRSNQSILKEISPGFSLEGLMLKLKLQYFGPPDAKSWLIRKTLILGKIEGRRRRDNRGWDGWMASPTRWTWVWANTRSWWWIGRPGMLWFMGSQRVRHDWETELNWGR